MIWRDGLSRLRALLGIAHGSRALGPPLQVSLNLTNRCNVRCVHCYYYSPHAVRPNLPDIWYGEAYRRFRHQALALNKRKAPVSGCDCNSCSHYTANLRVYRLLHPVRARLAGI